MFLLTSGLLLLIFFTSGEEETFVGSYNHSKLMYGIDRSLDLVNWTGGVGVGVGWKLGDKSGRK